MREVFVCRVERVVYLGRDSWRVDRAGDKDIAVEIAGIAAAACPKDADVAAHADAFHPDAAGSAGDALHAIGVVREHFALHTNALVRSRLAQYADGTASTNVAKHPEAVCVVGAIHAGDVAAVAEPNDAIAAAAFNLELSNARGCCADSDVAISADVQAIPAGCFIVDPKISGNAVGARVEPIGMAIRFSVLHFDDGEAASLGIIAGNMQFEAGADRAKADVAFDDQVVLSGIGIAEAIGD